MSEQRTPDHVVYSVAYDTSDKPYRKKCDKCGEPYTPGNPVHVCFGPRSSKEKVHGSVLSEAIDCCRSWEPEVRLIGNVRAIDLRDLLLELWKYRNAPEPALALSDKERHALYVASETREIDPTARAILRAMRDRVTAQPPGDDAARLNWWFMNVLYVGGDEDDDESGSEIEYEARLCRTPDEFRKLVDAEMGPVLTKGGGQ